MSVFRVFPSKMRQNANERPSMALWLISSSRLVVIYPSLIYLFCPEPPTSARPERVWCRRPRSTLSRRLSGVGFDGIKSGTFCAPPPLRIKIHFLGSRNVLLVRHRPLIVVCLSCHYQELLSSLGRSLLPVHPRAGSSVRRSRLAARHVAPL